MGSHAHGLLSNTDLGAAIPRRLKIRASVAALEATP